MRALPHPLVSVHDVDQMRFISIPEKLFQLLNDSLAFKVHFHDGKMADGWIQFFVGWEGFGV